MAGSYNKVLLMGNLTRDVELKYTPSNQAVAEVGLAVNYRYRTKEGENREEVTFVDCEAWGRTAENISKYLSKGKPIFIEGRLKLDQWQDKEGNKRSKLRVVVENFQFVDSRSAAGGGDGDSGGPRASGESRQPAAAASASAHHEPINEEDIPF